MPNTWIGLLKQHDWTQFQKPGVTLSHTTDSLPGSATFGKEKNYFLSWARVWKWQRGVRVHTTLFSGLPSRGDWWWEMSIKEETCPMVEWKHASLCSYRPLNSSLTLTSLGRGSLECGWTSALGYNSVGGYWLSNDSSIFPPGWWVLLKKKTSTDWIQGHFTLYFTG